VSSVIIGGPPCENAVKVWNSVSKTRTLQIKTVRFVIMFNLQKPKVTGGLYGMLI
jgi:hypothetical protein